MMGFQNNCGMHTIAKKARETWAVLVEDRSLGQDVVVIGKLGCVLFTLNVYLSPIALFSLRQFVIN